MVRKKLQDDMSSMRGRDAIMVVFSLKKIVLMNPHL